MKSNDIIALIKKERAKAEDMLSWCIETDRDESSINIWVTRFNTLDEILIFIDKEENK